MAGAETTPGWGEALLKKYPGQEAKPGGRLLSEIQDPWGMLVLDPHWSQIQVYEMPIPLWPTELVPGWRTHINTRYKAPAD